MARSALSPYFLRNLGRSLEQIVWRFRSYLVPSHIWTYWKTVREHSAPPPAGRPFVCFDFTRVDIDYESGRYAFLLFCEFEALGYRICFRKNYRFLATLRHKIHKRLLIRRPFHVCGSLEELPEGSVAAEITDRLSSRRRANCRQIRVRYEETWPESDQEMAMPFFVHPLNYDQWAAAPAPDLAERRPWRVFFAGRASGRYASNVLPERFGKMSRRQVLETLDAALPPDRLHRIETAADLLHDDAQHPRLTWAGLGSYRIPRAGWFDALGRADFFLACPGLDMPLCHNLIESLGRGTVPILEHPEYLDPPLEHNVNCLAFRGREELLHAFEQAFRLTPAEIERLRRGAHDYYRKHLAPGRFAQRLLDHPGVDLLVNAYRAPRRGPDAPATPAELPVTPASRFAGTA